MAESNKLPAIRDPADKSRELTPYALDTYFMADAPDGLHIAPLPDEARDLMRKRRNLNVRDWTIIVTSDIVTMGANAAPIPGLEKEVVALAGFTTLVGAVIGIPAYRIRTRNRQKRVEQTAFGSADALFLTNKWLGVDVSDGVLDESVSFVGNDGSYNLPAYTLLESVGGQAPGLRWHVDSDDEKYLQVSPGRLVAETFRIIGDENRNYFLQAAREPLSTISDAARQLPGIGLTPSTPNSLRSGQEKPAAALLLGTLAAYAVMRERAGPIVAGRVRDYYAHHKEEDNEDLWRDVVYLDHPARHGVSWAMIEDFNASVSD